METIGKFLLNNFWRLGIQRLADLERDILRLPSVDEIIELC
jgi:hypothetical protein